MGLVIQNTISLTDYVIENKVILILHNNPTTNMNRYGYKIFILKQYSLTPHNGVSSYEYQVVFISQKIPRINIYTQ